MEKEVGRIRRSIRILLLFSVPRVKYAPCHGANSGPRRQGEESNYDYSKLNKKGKIFYKTCST